MRLSLIRNSKIRSITIAMYSNLRNPPIWYFLFAYFNFGKLLNYWIYHPLLISCWFEQLSTNNKNIEFFNCFQSSKSYWLFPNNGETNLGTFNNSHNLITGT